MEKIKPRMNNVPCEIVDVQYTFEWYRCNLCQHSAPAVDLAERCAIDIHLDHPVLLHITISVHYCKHCQHYFRAQPPFLRPDAIYTNRVVLKAVQSVFEDNMAKRRVSDRLARDFWVKPSEASIRNWCHDHQNNFHFETDYQPWAIERFSGILCVDEVYQNNLALLLAVDPASPQGDRLIGYQLVNGSVDGEVMNDFMSHLQELGIAPEEVITDGSTLYPATIRKVWPTAVHQLCLFHETRHVTRAVMQAIQAIRKELPSPPPRERLGKGGPFVTDPPSEDLTHPDTRRWYQRKLRRQQGIAEVHRLRKEGLSQRAISRQTGLHRSTVRNWLLEPTPTIPVLEEMEQQVKSIENSITDMKPPDSWLSWEEVIQVRETLQKDRFLFVTHPNHLSETEQCTISNLLASPVGEKLQLVYAFMKEWYAFWGQTDGKHQPITEVMKQYQEWQACVEYHQFKPLKRIQERINQERFGHICSFLLHDHWEATNNGAERMGRNFRHHQAPHFNLRSEESIHGMISLNAIHQMQCACTLSVAYVDFPTRGRVAA